MIKFNALVFCLAANLAFSQAQDFAKAPNSYIYDLDLAASKNYGGIEISVAKAYAMWAGYEYLKTNGQPNPIPAGVQSASIYWEDVPGLIESVGIEPGAQPADSKIKVNINKGVGKGNAVVAFKVDGVIYWSWHIWATDNPSNGTWYAHGTETDINGNLYNIQYMDRNLGATSNGFLGNQWQKSGGLMYEWGRKDPFPPLVYKDATFYQISGDAGVMRHKQVDAQNTIPVVVRPFDEIEKNMAYAVKNPITYIVNTESTGNWFSNNRYKVAGASPDYKTWDLWSDNAKGGNSNGNSSNAALKNESRSYELKSELDPCPNGWRVPSYMGRETQNNNLAFFGKHDWNNDDGIAANRQLFPNAVNPSLNGVKVYPGLGMDFTNAQDGARNIGIVPVSGGYVYYPNSGAPSAPVGVTFQDNASNGGLWSATFGYDGARIFSLISDPARTSTAVGLHAIYNNITNPTKAGNAVRCMRDPNLAIMGDFPTEYFTTNKVNYTKGLDDPNAYLVTNETHLSIPVSKAFSVYNQLLSDQKMLRSEDLVAKLVWSSSRSLIAEISLLAHDADGKNSTIEVDLNNGEYGNAVVGLYYDTPDSEALWSWHIWAPETDPRAAAVTYTTESPIATTYNFVNATVSKSPPLTTTFMDRNLGAMTNELNASSKDAVHYQWGRKDPIPAFLDLSEQYIYIPKDETYDPLEADRLGAIKALSGKKYEYDYTDPYDVYGSTNQDEKTKLRNNILYSINNPMRFLYQRNLGVIYDGGNHYGNDLSKIRDWASNERAQGADRWGHADKKSVFDPCPQGWRVPDVSNVNLYSGSKGNSPWYNSYNADAYGKPGVIQDQWHAISTFYGGAVANNGWKLNSPTFPLGNFSKDGMRGELGEKKISLDRSGVWTAAMADLRTGFALAMVFQDSKMQTGTGVYPQAAMGVRCAKDETRLLGVAPTKQAEVSRDDQPKLRETLVKTESTVNVTVYPNPFSSVFSINADGAQQYEIYDLTGKLLQKGSPDNGKVNGAALPKGVYLLKVFMADGSSVSKKIMKQ